MASVFRKSAIERLSSPDRLDSMLKITSPMSWVGIAAAGVLAGVVVIWSFTGTIPTTASVPGFVVFSYNTNTLYSTAAGKIAEVLAAPGEMVSAGTPVLTVSSADGRAVDVVSDQNGIISEIFVEKGMKITPNTEIFRLSPQTENAHSVVCYVDLDLAKQLRTGMEAAVYLNAVDSGSFGHMEATVTNIDNYAASEAALCEVLGQDGQMASYVLQNGPVAAVTCELLADDTTISGYAFSSDHGAEVPVTGGEQATVQIILDESAPISRVFPMLGGE